MTNREKIDRLSNKDVAKKIKELSTINGFEYVNWEKWLESEDDEIIYNGEMCRFKLYDNMFIDSDWLTGILVDDVVINGIAHKVIIYRDKLYKIPWNRVKKIDDFR